MAIYGCEERQAGCGRAPANAEVSPAQRRELCPAHSPRRRSFKVWGGFRLKREPACAIAVHHPRHHFSTCSTLISYFMAEIKPIHFSNRSASNNLEGLLSVAEAMRQQFAAVSQADRSTSAIEILVAFAALCDRLDNEYGESGPLALAGIEEALNEALRSCAELQAEADALKSAGAADAADAVCIGIALWAMRHDQPIRVAEPLVNALGRRANAGTTRQDMAAVYALMQGAVAHLHATLGADLERSNPERPWRILNLNFAITAIRTGDGAMIDHAFAQLNAALPDEATGFYEDALRLAVASGVPADISAKIEAQLAARRQPMQLH